MGWKAEVSVANGGWTDGGMRNGLTTAETRRQRCQCQSVAHTRHCSGGAVGDGAVIAGGIVVRRGICRGGGPAMAVIGCKVHLLCFCCGSGWRYYYSSGQWQHLLERASCGCGTAALVVGWLLLMTMMTILACWRVYRHMTRRHWSLRALSWQLMEPPYLLVASRCAAALVRLRLMLVATGNGTAVLLLQLLLLPCAVHHSATVFTVAAAFGGYLCQVSNKFGQPQRSEFILI
jgi:hypothetical protein